MRLFPGAPACVCFVVLALVVLGSRRALWGEARGCALCPGGLGGLWAAGAVPALHHGAPVLPLLPQLSRVGSPGSSFPGGMAGTAMHKDKAVPG